MGLSIAWVIGIAPALADQALSLDKAYGLALANAPAVQAAKYGVDARMASVERARGERWPTLSLDGSQGRAQFDAADSGIDPQTLERQVVTTEVQETQTTIGLSLSQPIYDRTISQGIDRAQSELRAARGRVAVQKQKLATDVARAYVSVLRERASVRLGRAEIRAFRLQVERVEQRLQRGLGDRLGLLEAKGRLSEARARMMKALNNLELARLELERLIGQPVKRVRAAQPRQMLDAPVPSDERISRWRRQAVRSNPRVRVAMRRLETREEVVDERRAERFPKLSLEVGVRDTDRTDQVTSGQTARVMLQLRMPLYSGGRISAGVDAALAEAQQQRALLDEARRKAVLDVRRAANDLRTAIQRLDVLQGSLRTASTAVDQARQGLQSGLRDRVDLLDAKAREFRVRRDLADAAYNRIAALVRIRGLTGNMSRAALAELDNRYFERTIRIDHAAGAGAP